MDRLSRVRDVKYFNRKVEYRNRLLISAIPLSQIVLDLGCGNGAYLRLLLKKSKQVIGVDISKGLCQYAKSRNPECHIIVAEASHLPFRSRSFDGVWASEVLEHTSFLAFDEVKRITKKWFLVTMPNPYSSNYRADTSHVLYYSFALIRRYYKSWANWEISVNGTGIELPAYRVKIPRLIKRLSMALLWHFPIFAPTISIRGKRI